MTLDLVEGVQHLHGMGIAHRDIKPGNVLVFGEQGGGFHAEVADFGFAAGDRISVHLISANHTWRSSFEISPIGTYSVDRDVEPPVAGPVPFTAQRRMHVCAAIDVPAKRTSSSSFVDHLSVRHTSYFARHHAEIGEQCPGLMGTAGYMPLESLRSGMMEASAGQDVFAVAMVLVMVCLRPEHRYPNLCSNPVSDSSVVGKGPKQRSQAPWFAARRLFVYARRPSGFADADVVCGVDDTREVGRCLLRHKHHEDVPARPARCGPEQWHFSGHFLLSLL